MSQCPPRYSGYKRDLSVRINAIFCCALFGVQINSTFYAYLGRWRFDCSNAKQDMDLHVTLVHTDYFRVALKCARIRIQLSVWFTLLGLRLPSVLLSPRPGVTLSCYQLCAIYITTDLACAHASGLRRGGRAGGRARLRRIHAVRYGVGLSHINM